jgi:COP9 signalosome complex subunit 6
LPSLDTDQFHKDFTTEYIDSLLLTYLATITKGSNQANEVMEKVSVAYASRRR